MISFEQPLYLLGIPVSLLLAFFLQKLVLERAASRSILIANFNLIQEIKKGKWDFWPRLFPALQLLSICFLWIALSEPVIFVDKLVKSAQVLLAIDISKSMTAEDLTPNRLTAAKEAATQFIDELPKGVEVGIEFFDKNAVLALPITRDKNLAKKTIASLNTKSLGNGTALGEAILLASKSFKANGARHLIMLSDGESNSGIDPSDALVRANRMIIHTVGIGSTVGVAVSGGLLTQLNREELEQIAAATGGSYFNAGEDTAKLKEIYRSFAKNYRVERVKNNLFGLFTLLGLFSAAAAFLLSWTKFGSI